MWLALRSVKSNNVDFLNQIRKVEFASYIIPQNEIDINNFRLLDVDNRAGLPINTFIRIIITATDVLHSWTVPRLGVKADDQVATQFSSRGWVDPVPDLIHG